VNSAWDVTQLETCVPNPHIFQPVGLLVILQVRLQRAATLLKLYYWKCMHRIDTCVQSCLQATVNYILYQAPIFLRRAFWSSAWTTCDVGATFDKQVKKKLNLHTIATRLRAGRYGVRMPAGAEICLFFGTSRPGLGPTQPPIKCVSGFFPGIKRPGGEVYHLHLTPRLRMSRAIPLLPLCVFMAWKATDVL
jgi:hypothetical protein